MRKIEAVSAALRATPPEIRGLLVDGNILPLSGFDGSGMGRVFTFVGISGYTSRTFRSLLKSYELVALKESSSMVRLDIRFRFSFFSCPSCGLRVGHSGFWDHYNKHHAVRPYWLNRSDWSSIVRSEYQEPPEYS